MAPLTSDGGVAVPSVPVHRAFTEEQPRRNRPLTACVPTSITRVRAVIPANKGT